MIAMPATPALTVYFWNPRRKNARTAIHHLDALPLDWLDLKLTLEFVAEKVFREYGLSTIHVILIRHLPGRYMVKTSSSYQRVRVRIKQLPLMAARLRYNRLTGKVKADQASFDSSLWDVQQQYYEERGKCFRSPPLVPPGFLASMQNGITLLKEQSGLKQPVYIKEPTASHGSVQIERKMIQPYAIVPQDLYGPRERSIVHEENRF